jgi:hypothetical protein
MAGEVVRLKNKGKTQFVGKYAQTRYAVEPGGELIVPREAMWHWFGRPFLVDTGKHKDRTTEWKRLQTLYGLFDDEAGSYDEKFKQNVPQVEVYDLDGERIITVIDDPTGANISPADQTRQEKELLDEQIAKMRQELNALQAAQAQVQLEGYEPTSDAVEEDTPKKVPVGASTAAGRRGRER